MAVANPSTSTEQSRHAGLPDDALAHTVSRVTRPRYVFSINQSLPVGEKMALLETPA
jgi:hypothetical protein